jgi:hypothetical protein
VFSRASQSPRERCEEAAINISLLMQAYSTTYGFNKSCLMNAHCLTSAATVYVLSISSQEASSSDPVQIETYLAEAIRGLGQMNGTYRIIYQYQKYIRNLIYKWCKPIPPSVQLAIDQTIALSPTPSKSSSPQNVPVSAGTITASGDNLANVEPEPAEENITPNFWEDAVQPMSPWDPLFLGP